MKRRNRKQKKQTIENEAFKVEFGNFVEEIPLKLAVNYKSEDFWVDLTTLSIKRELFSPLQRLSRFGYLVVSENYQPLIREFLKEFSAYDEDTIEKIVILTAKHYRKTFFGIGSAHKIMHDIARTTDIAGDAL